MTIGDKIKILRKQYGVSQEQFADDMHVSRQTVSRWENNTAVVKSDDLETISQYFGLTMRDFLAVGESSKKENLPLVADEAAVSLEQSPLIASESVMKALQKASETETKDEEPQKRGTLIG